MEQPSKKIEAGIRVVIPVLYDLINDPKRLEFGRCTPHEFEQVKEALNWLAIVANRRERRRNTF
jgi:hypothetical protein